MITLAAKVAGHQYDNAGREGCWPSI